MDNFTQMIPTTLAEPPNGEYKYREYPEIHDGKQLLAKYENGYGASVIQNRMSYGGREGLFEIAVTHPESLCYATSVTNDVIGHLTEEKCVEVLHQIAALPRNDNCDHTHHWDDDEEDSDYQKNMKNPELREFYETSDDPMIKLNRMLEFDFEDLVGE